MHTHFQISRKSVWLVLAGFLIVAACTSAQTVRVKVPFQFTVGKAPMAAGTYTIAALSDSAQGMELIWGMDRSTSGSHDYFTSSPIEDRGRKNETDLVFRCFNNECFLSQVWTAGNHVGRQLPLQVPARLLANAAPAPHEIVLAALR